MLCIGEAPATKMPFLQIYIKALTITKISHPNSAYAMPISYKLRTRINAKNKLMIPAIIARKKTGFS